MKNKKIIIWLIASFLTLVGSMFMYQYFVNTSSWVGILCLVIGAVLLGPAVKGWSELIELLIDGNRDEN